MKCGHLPEIKRINTGYGPVLGIDVKTKEITGIHIGRRIRKDAKKF